MRKEVSKILVTGGAGFIGSAFVRLAVKCGYGVIVVDKLSYAGDLERLKEVENRIKFIKTDISHKEALEHVFQRVKPQIVVHFAAETHVDRSIICGRPFTETNILGTQVLLDVARKYKTSKFVHISTDEVYGDIAKGKFCELSPLAPNSPYSASKAAADLIIRSYVKTYDFPAVIVRPCNNYGPWQYPEKFIARSIFRVFNNQKIPIYAKGNNVREWLYVDDCAKGVLKVMLKGKTGEIYNLGSNQAKKNLDVAKLILRLFHGDTNNLEFVRDRPGHDFRYRLDSRKVFRDTGWRAEVDFREGLKKYIQWCQMQRPWILNKAIKSEKIYQR